MTKNTNPLIIVVDGGGSTCRVSIVNLNGITLGQATGGSANITSHFDESLKNIQQTINQAYKTANISLENQKNSYAYLGLAGGKTPELSERLKQNLGFLQTEVVSDRRIMVQGVMGNDDGTIVATGTGSFFVHRINGQLQKVGGWGLNLGDEASGAYLGKKLLQTTLHAHDGITDHSPLTRETFAHFEASPRTMINFARTATPSDYGKFSPKIVHAMQQGDPVAKYIMNKATNNIVDVLKIWDVTASGSLYMLGGLGHIYADLLPQQYKDLIKPPQNDAIHGGIQLAIQKWGSCHK